jgi:hypothetical protein
VSFLSRCSPRYLTWSAQGSCTLHASLLEPGLDCVEVDLELLRGCGGVTVRGDNGCVVSKGGYGYCLGCWKSAVYMRYKNGPRTLPWGTPA